MKWVDIVVLVFHTLGATVWAGGHLILALSVLPRALERRSPEMLLEFESAFERVGLPALALQFVTGMWLIYRILPTTHGLARIHTIGVTSLKLVLFVATIAVAADARLRLIPRLTPDTMRPLARHIIIVTVMAVLLVIAGIGYQVGPH